jgi:hypothetical protein
VHEVQPHYKLLDGIPCPLHSPKGENPIGLHRGSKGATGLVRLAQSVWKSFIQKLSDCKVPVWRDIILLKENFWLNACHPRDCSETLHEPTERCQCLLKAYLHSSYGGHCLSLETVPTIAWWTVFHVFAPHIPDIKFFCSWITEFVSR